MCCKYVQHTEKKLSHRKTSREYLICFKQTVPNPDCVHEALVYPYQNKRPLICEVLYGCCERALTQESNNAPRH